jgi:hypothetical protein
VRENLADYSSVIVLGMQRVSADLVVKLEPYIRDGGSAIFFLSGKCNPFEYNERFAKDDKGLLPVRLGGIESPEKASSLGIKLSATTHPAFSFLADEKLLSGGETARYMTLASAAGVIKKDAVAFFSNGRPAILENKVGQGRVMIFCTAAGPPDNFLPASAAYPILLQETLRYLAGNPDLAVNLEIGQVFHQDVMISAQHLVLRKPDGAKVRLTPVQAGKDQTPTVSFDQTDQMGLYTIEAQAGAVKRPRFVVNLQATEGDLDRIEEKDAAAMFAGANWLRPGAAIEAVAGSRYAQTELAGPLLWVLAVLLAVETAMAVRFGLRRHS